MPDGSSRSLPCMTDHTRGLGYLLWSRLHCAGGDVLILLGAHSIVSLLLGTRAWSREARLGPGALFVGLGLAYTVWSEWYNTAVVRSWAYSPEMPVIAGIGVASMLQ